MTTPVGAVASDANSTAASTKKPAGGSIFSKKYGPLKGWAWAGIVGAGALAFMVWRSHSKTAAANTTAAATVSQFGQSTTGFGASIATLQGEVQQLQGQLARTAATTVKTTAGTTATKTTSTTKPTTVGPQVNVPNVVGQRANFGIGELDSLGFKYTSATGDRDPASEYDISAQQPKGGTKAAKGSTVTLSFKKL
jgi:hypothetical protein